MSDFIATATDLTCLQVEVTAIADQLGMLNQNRLKAP